MAVIVVDRENQLAFAANEQPRTDAIHAQETTEPVKEPDEAVKAAEDDKTDEYGLTAAERKALGDKFDKIVGKRHKAMKEAQEAAADAESFARTQYQERQLAQARVAELEARMKELESKTAPQTEEVKEPQPEDFKEGVEFARALAKFEADKAVKADRQLRAEEARQKEHAELDARRIERNRAFAKTVPDYEETVSALAEHDLEVPPVMAQYLMESESSPAVMYHFAKHPDEFEAIAHLSPIKAIAAMGKLEMKLAEKPVEDVKEAPPKANGAAQSKAPEPIRPLAGTTGSVHKPLSEMTTRETIEYWDARKASASTKRQRH